MAFEQRVQLVEQMRIDADAGGDGEEARAALAFKIGIFHAAQGDAPGRGSQERWAAPAGESGKRRS